MYTHLGMGQMKAVYETSTVEPLIERAQEVVDKGLQCTKGGDSPPFGATHGFARRCDILPI